MLFYGENGEHLKKNYHVWLKNFVQKC